MFTVFKKTLQRNKYLYIKKQNQSDKCRTLKKTIAGSPVCNINQGWIRPNEVMTEDSGFYNWFIRVKNMWQEIFVAGS